MNVFKSITIHEGVQQVGILILETYLYHKFKINFYGFYTKNVNS